MNIDIAYYELFDMFLALRQYFSGERFKPFTKEMDVFIGNLDTSHKEIIKIMGVLTNGYLSALKKLLNMKLTSKGSGETFLLSIFENPGLIFENKRNEINDEFINEKFDEYMDLYNKNNDLAKSIGETLSSIWSDIFSREKAQYNGELLKKIKNIKKNTENTDLFKYLGTLSDRFYLDDNEVVFRIKPEFRIKIKSIDNIIIMPSIFASRNLTFWHERNNLIFFISLDAKEHKALEPSDMLMLVTSAFNDKTRLKMLSYISRKNCSAADLAEYLQVNPSTVSRHLKVFKDAGFE